MTRGKKNKYGAILSLVVVFFTSTPHFSVSNYSYKERKGGKVKMILMFGVPGGQEGWRRG